MWHEFYCTCIKLESLIPQWPQIVMYCTKMTTDLKKDCLYSWPRHSIPYKHYIDFIHFYYYCVSTVFPELVCFFSKWLSNTWINRYTNDGWCNRHEHDITYSNENKPTESNKKKTERHPNVVCLIHRITGWYWSNLRRHQCYRRHCRLSRHHQRNCSPSGLSFSNV